MQHNRRHFIICCRTLLGTPNCNKGAQHVPPHSTQCLVSSPIATCPIAICAANCFCTVQKVTQPHTNGRGAHQLYSSYPKPSIYCLSAVHTQEITPSILQHTIPLPGKIPKSRHSCLVLLQTIYNRDITVPAIGASHHRTSHALPQCKEIPSSQIRRELLFHPLAHGIITSSSSFAAGCIAHHHHNVQHSHHLKAAFDLPAHTATAHNAAASITATSKM